jgi:PAS domain-containing protein
MMIGARKLRDSETMLKLATEVAQLGIFVWRPTEDRASWENDRMYEIFGQPCESGPVNGAPFLEEMVLPDYRKSFQDATEATLQKGEPFHFE